MMYEIKDWNRYFEVNRTREMKRMRWVPIPNRFDGDGYTELMDHENAAQHFAAWVLLLEVASKCDPRGTLLRDGGKPHTPQSLARLTRVPAGIFQEAIPRLVQIGWLTQTPDSQPVTPIPHLPAENPHPPAGIPQEGAYRREGKGMEEKSNISPPLTPPLTEKQGNSHAGKSFFKDWFNQLVAVDHFRAVTYEQFLTICRLYPKANIEKAITRALIDADLMGDGLNSPGMFLKKKFEQTELDAIKKRQPTKNMDQIRKEWEVEYGDMDRTLGDVLR